MLGAVSSRLEIRGFPCQFPTRAWVRRWAFLVQRWAFLDQRWAFLVQRCEFWSKGGSFGFKRWEFWVQSLDCSSKVGLLFKIGRFQGCWRVLVWFHVGVIGVLLRSVSLAVDDGFFYCWCRSTVRSIKQDVAGFEWFHHERLCADLRFETYKGVFFSSARACCPLNGVE